MNVILKQASPSDYERIKVFYHNCKYGGGLNRLDTVFIAEIDNEIVGSVRICQQFTTTVLRGMQVSKKWQRQNIGTRLLLLASSWLKTTPCYCLPYSYLEGFYNKTGFQKINPADAPDFLSNRYNQYLKQGLNCIMMLRFFRD
ncbi:MAG: GNAT family N-acetyltransferase [Xenococcaceae cyanobacterium MO_188.B19]|nr:GNAT family N-acetyltransferase [Xenococcaceae cyanobacterium MO_188.B19]